MSRKRRRSSVRADEFEPSNKKAREVLWKVPEVLDEEVLIR